MLQRTDGTVAHSDIGTSLNPGPTHRVGPSKEETMLRNTKDIDNYTVRATDGEIGHIKDQYFDDDAWVIRYFVVETGTWMDSRKVLISPMSVLQPDWHGKSLPVSITKEQVRTSPDIDSDKPISRQNEGQYYGHYGYSNYWDGVGVWGDGMVPFGTTPAYVATGQNWEERQREDLEALEAERNRHRNDDPHLRSCATVTGYDVQATDGEIGHVAGFLVDEISWAIRYLVVDTSNWWMGKQVLIAPPWITGLQWADKKMVVDLSRDAIKSSPLYDPKALLDRAWELNLHTHYGRNGYWSRGEASHVQRE